MIGSAFLQRRRTPNVMADIKGFVSQWNDPGDPANDTVFELHSTPYGNINDNGQPGLYRSPELTPHQAQFASAIEDGVRSLVMLLVKGFGWITYCSCAGHEYPGLDIEPAERHVGLLPRDPAEQADMIDVIGSAIESSSAAYAIFRPVEVGLAIDLIEDETEQRETLEIWFSRAAGADWPEYFAHLDSVYRALAASLEAAGPRQ